MSSNGGMMTQIRVGELIDTKQRIPINRDDRCTQKSARAMYPATPPPKTKKMTARESNPQLLCLKSNQRKKPTGRG